MDAVQSEVRGQPLLSGLRRDYSRDRLRTRIGRGARALQDHPLQRWTTRRGAGNLRGTVAHQSTSEEAYL